MPDYTLNIRTLEKFVRNELADMGLEDFEAIEDDSKDVEERMGDIATSTHVVTIWVDYDEWVEWWGDPRDATDYRVWLDTMTSQYDFFIEPVSIRVEEDSIVAEFYFSESYE